VQKTPGFDFDLLTIGAGSGGVAATRRAAALGARAAIVERDRVGGTCVIRGCVPKKLMMYASQFGEAFTEATAYGWTVTSSGFDLGRWVAAKGEEIDRLEDVYRGMLSGSGVELIAGSAVLIDPHTVSIGRRRVTAANILIATGGSPSDYALPGLGHALTSNDVLSLPALPRRMAVLGGGYIAAEFASIFAGMGAEVALVFRDALPLRGFDADLRKRLAAALAVHGIRLVGGNPPVDVQRTVNGAHIRLGNGEAIEADVVLNATGRRPNTKGLGLEALGIAVDGAGAIPVDAYSETPVAGVYAIGDVTNRKNLTPIAIAEGRAFAETLYGQRPTRVDHSLVATAVFTTPPVASIGLSEADAARAGSMRIYESDFRPMRSAFAGRSDRTYMKLVVDDASDKVVGVHMIGADAPEIVQSLAVAMTCGATKRDFDQTIAVHPTSAEEFVLMREAVRKT
jgi:glutathione reductase (NADPH)